MLQTVLDFILAAVTNSTPPAWNFPRLSTEVLHPRNPSFPGKLGQLVTLLALDLILWFPNCLWLACLSCSWSPRVTSGNPDHESPPAFALPALAPIAERPALFNI